MITLPHTVTVQRASSSSDRYGNSEPDWSAPSEAEVRAFVQQRTLPGEQHADGRQVVVTGWVAFMDPATAIAAGDRVVWDGRTFEVDGVPGSMWTTTAAHHLEVALRTVDG
jgi:hypothetical protein